MIFLSLGRRSSTSAAAAKGCPKAAMTLRAISRGMGTPPSRASRTASDEVFVRATQRKAHLEAANVMQKGKLVHIDGAGHNLHHDELKEPWKCSPSSCQLCNCKAEVPQLVSYVC